MNLLDEVLNAWGAAMWRASWQGGLAALAVGCVCRLAPSMPARFQSWLWRLVALKFIVALLWSSPIELPLLPASALPEPAWAEMSLTASSPTNWDSSIPPPSDLIPAESAPIPEHRPLRFVTPWLIPFLAWIVFVGRQAARILIACRNAHRLRNGCRRSEDKTLLDELAKLSESAGLGAPPMLLETDGNGSPLLLGIVRPAIVIPTTTLNRLDASERALVIGHELAHIRRADLFWSVVAALVRSVFFFHPLAWLSEQRLRLTQEIAADEFAIALQQHNPVSYAAVLVSVISKLGPARSIPIMSVGVAGSQQSLQQRFAAMRFMKLASRRAVVAYGIFLGLVAVPAIVSWTVVAAEAPATEKPRTDDKPRTGDRPRTDDKSRTDDKPATATKVEPKEATASGKFVSFKAGILKVALRNNRTDKWEENEWKVAENIKVVSYIRGSTTEKPAGEAFKIWESGATIVVKLRDGKVNFVEIGSKPTTEKAAPREANKMPEKAPAKAADKEAPKEKIARGMFVSFEERVLTLKHYKARGEFELIKTSIPENAQTSVWNLGEGRYQSVGTAEAMNRLKSLLAPVNSAHVETPEAMNWRKAAGMGLTVQIAPEKVTLRIGENKKPFLGNFVSFKDDFLYFRPSPDLQKRYGDIARFKMNESIPVFDSVDGSEYKLLGTPRAAFDDVKDGTSITVYHHYKTETDEFYLVLVGASTKK